MGFTETVRGVRSSSPLRTNCPFSANKIRFSWDAEAAVMLVTRSDSTLMSIGSESRRVVTVVRPKLYSNSPSVFSLPSPASERITLLPHTNPKRFLKNTLFWITWPENEAKGLLVSSPTLLGAVLRCSSLNSLRPVLVMNKGRLAEA